MIVTCQCGCNMYLEDIDGVEMYWCNECFYAVKIEEII